MCDYLNLRGNSRMSYTSIESKELGQKRMEKKGLVIQRLHDTTYGNFQATLQRCCC